MKRLLILMVLVIGTALIIKVFAYVNDNSDSEKILSFYHKYAVAYNIKDYRQSNAQCDSILSVYCTSKMCKDTKEDRVNGVSYDFATDNMGIDEAALKTLRVVQNGDHYVVTYRLNDINDRFQKIVRNVKLQVTMSNGKIATVQSVK